MAEGNDVIFELCSKYKFLQPYTIPGNAVSEYSSRHVGICVNMREFSGVYDSHYSKAEDNSIINPSIHSTLIVPHSIESNQSATHSLSQTDPKLNGSHNIGEWNLDSNDESAYSQLKLLRVKHFNRIIIALNINSIRNKLICCRI